MSKSDEPVHSVDYAAGAAAGLLVRSRYLRS